MEREPKLILTHDAWAPEPQVIFDDEVEGSEISPEELFYLHGHHWQVVVSSDPGGPISVLCLDPVFDETGTDYSTWPSDEEVSRWLGFPVEFDDRGDHPEYVEGIFRRTVRTLADLVAEYSANGVVLSDAGNGEGGPAFLDWGDEEVVAEYGDTEMFPVSGGDLTDEEIANFQLLMGDDARPEYASEWNTTGAGDNPYRYRLLF